MTPLAGQSKLVYETPQRVAVNAANDGANTVIAADAARKIKILGGALTVTAAGLLLVRSAATVIGQLSLAANGGLVMAPVPDGAIPYFETAVGEAFILETAVGMDALGFLVYVLEA